MAVERPASVAAVAWIWIISGVFILVTGVLGIGGLSQLSELTPPDQRPAMTPVLAAMSGLSHYLIWFTVVQMMVAAVAVVAGVYYLQLRAWARGVLELLTWMSLALTASLGFFWMPMWLGLSGDLLPRDAGVDVATLQWVGVAAGAAVVIAGAVPLGMMIKALRSKAVKDAIGAPPAR